MGPSAASLPCGHGRAQAGGCGCSGNECLATITCQEGHASPSLRSIARPRPQLPGGCLRDGLVLRCPHSLGGCGRSSSSLSLIWRVETLLCVQCQGNVYLMLQRAVVY